MPIRLLRPKRDGHWTEPAGERPAPAEVGPRVSQRQFLKTVAAAVGLAGAAELAQVVAPAPAFAYGAGNFSPLTAGSATTPPSPYTLNVVTTIADDGIAVLGGSQQDHNLWVGANGTAHANNGIVQAGDREIIYGGTASGQTNGGLVLAPWDAGTSGMRLSPEGKVAIWSQANPRAPLDVNGFIAANGTDPITGLPHMVNSAAAGGWKIGLWGQSYAIGAAHGTIALLAGTGGWVSVFDPAHPPANDVQSTTWPPDSQAASSLGSNGDGHFKGNVRIGAITTYPFPAALSIAQGGQFMIGSTLIADSSGSYYAP